jgi:hypothetical protein
MSLRSLYISSVPLYLFGPSISLRSLYVPPVFRSLYVSWGGSLLVSLNVSAGVPLVLVDAFEVWVPAFV